MAGDEEEPGEQRGAQSGPARPAVSDSIVNLIHSMVCIPGSKPFFRACARLAERPASNHTLALACDSSANADTKSCLQKSQKYSAICVNPCRIPQGSSQGSASIGPLPTMARLHSLGKQVYTFLTTSLCRACKTLMTRW